MKKGVKIALLILAILAILGTLYYFFIYESESDSQIVIVPYTPPNYGGSGDDLGNPSGIG